MSDTKACKDNELPRYALPSDYMRARRPEQFSDTQDVEERVLDRGYFEYHLETLTSRGEEKLFEHFARKLCEKLICPNLIPQTGPTGGGDSKVDTETYPVSSDIAGRWFLGTEAASERWGFAFSAKQDWQPKCKSDIRKISETGRDYKAVYFVSNQFIPDRKRAELEDDLTRQYGFTVRILDRNWLVEAVIEKGNKGLAIDTLALSVPTHYQKNTGSGDKGKKEALEFLEKRISDVAKRPSVDVDLVDDCLAAAICSRELEEPREITEGRFKRAERYAREVGVTRLFLSILYQHAWTECYWFDDFAAASSLYDKIEQIALSSGRIEDVECAVNIWQTLYSVHQRGLLPQNDILKERTDRLIAHLEKVAAELDRPNNAANAKGLLLLVRIVLDRENEERLGEHLRDLGGLFEDAKNLGGFQFQRFREMFELLGEVLGEHPIYDEIFESLLTIVEKRNSEAAAGQQLFKRGLQKIEADHPYDAIRLLGRAMARFIKHEEHRRLESSLAGLAQAYGACGLYWAEYCALMSLLSMVLRRFEDDHSVSVRNGLKVISTQMTLNCLRTGNVPGFLHFYKLEKILCASLQENMGPDNGRDDSPEVNTRDIVFAIALFNATQDQLKTLAYLPSHLEQLGLLMSSFAVNFMLGGSKKLREENCVPASASDEEIWEIVSRTISQPTREQISNVIELRDGKHAVCYSHLLGVHWKIIADNEPLTVRVAQSFLGFIEAILATSLNEEIIPAAASIELRFVSKAHDDPTAKDLLSLREDEDHEYWEIEVNVRRFEHASEYMIAMRDCFVDFFSNIVPNSMMISDGEGFLRRIVGLEEGFDRALAFSDMVTTATNVFSSDTEETLEVHVSTGQPVEETVTSGFKAKLRDLIHSSQPNKVKDAGDEPRFGTGEPPSNLIDLDRISHKQCRVVSPINLKKWDKAKWIGVAVGARPNSAPPFLGLIFENENAARSIFKDWRSAGGEEDVDDAIRVAIVRGLTTSDPYGYGVIVGANWQMAKMQPGDMTVSISRMKYIEHPNPKNLEMFLQEYRSFGGFLLAPAISDDGFRDVRFLTDSSIAKRHIHVRSAWEIGEHDPDSIILQPYHEPIVPQGVNDAPVKALMESKRARATAEVPKDNRKETSRRVKKGKGMWRP